MMTRFRSTVAVFASLVLSQVSFANDAELTCVMPNNIPAQPSLESWQALRPILAAQLNQCLHSDEYFALYGASLLYTGRISRAVEMLERSLLINPFNGSARLDYAQALFQSNQLIAALQVNQALLDEPNLPEHLKGYLEERKAAWSKQLHYWDNQFTYLYGHSSNLNNATNIEQLNLISADQLIPAIIAPDYRAQSGGFHYASLLSRYYSLTPDGTERLSFAVNTRDSHLDQADTDELKLTYETETESLNQRNHWSIGLEHLRLGDNGLYSALDGKFTVYPRSEPTSYVELEGRYVDFTGQSLLDETSFMVRPGLIFSDNNMRFGFEIGFGLNKQIDDRAGGDRSQQEASIFYDLALFRGRLTSRLSYLRTHDSESYSSLFGDNKRDTKSLTTSIQYFYPINNDWIIHGSYYHRDQESNIDLFDTKTESIDLGFTYRF
ncbi:hypothetical protein MAQ5080_00394 [Marinomonas aquimarina]|uniref:Tetratricopeptide repeat protein n=1 Tax=Marinomonas aquimarina TaxID=295068 RepID=A0A1A8T1N9_9GAMM|nr:tetratricopeptide repeat protein [Marinomonas aquimarina]SBS25879.1 hypothetical protein MAQ5080_00394 [Marinomonas aquimarina]